MLRTWEEAASVWFSNQLCVSDPKPEGVHSRWQTRKPMSFIREQKRACKSLFLVSASLSHSVLPKPQFLL